MAEQLTPQQRQMNFNRLTRQHLQMSADIPAQENSNITFDLSKSRLTSRVRMEITGDLKVTHATNTSYTPSPFAPFNLINRVSIDINNGFSPFTVSGRDLYLYSLLDDHAHTFTPATSGRGSVVQGLTASAAGADNKIRFLVDLPVALNDRDSVGLLLTQNQETTVTVSVFFGAAANLVTGAGYTVALSNLKVSPVVETFSVPPSPEALPDISVLKLVQTTKKSIAGGGLQELHLPVGMTYRKLILFIEDASGNGIPDDAFTSNFELVMNQADSPYRVKPSILAGINHRQFGTPLPVGAYAFDFSYNGLANYGTARDYVDTERLTEFWFRFVATAPGNVTAIYEVLSRLRTA